MDISWSACQSPAVSGVLWMTSTSTALHLGQLANLGILSILHSMRACVPESCARVWQQIRARFPYSTFTKLRIGSVFYALDARLIHALFGECPFAAGFRSFLLMLFASAVLLLEGRNVILSPLGSNPGRLTDSPLAGALVSLGVCAMGILNVPVWSTVTFFSGACTMVFSFSWFDP